jgi:hypothetical protein
MKSDKIKIKQIVHIYTQQHWLVSYVLHPVRFFASLPIIVPLGSVLSFEGYKPARMFREFLRTYAPETRVQYLTDQRVWTEQVRLTDSFAEAFAAFSYETPREAKFSHLHGFSKTGRMLFWFHDAFEYGDLAVARTVSASRLRRFCSALGPQFALREPIC